MSISRARRHCFYFGTVERHGFIPTPNSGADSSPTGWSAEGTLGNGGGYAFNSWGSHKRYTFEWPSTSARRAAQLLKSYADGTFGRGLIYFQDPLSFDTNVLAARWADPSMVANSEGGSHVYGIDPSVLPASGSDLPVKKITYDLASVNAGFRGVEDAVYVMIPEGFSLLIGAHYSATGTGGVFYSPQLDTGGIGAPVRVGEVTSNEGYTYSQTVSGVPGVWLWVGRTSVAASTVTLHAMTGRLIESEKAVANTPAFKKLCAEPWMGGQGHSGVRFAQKPSYVENSGVNGGQVGYAATFIETGSWSNG